MFYFALSFHLVRIGKKKTNTPTNNNEGVFRFEHFCILFVHALRCFCTSFRIDLTLNTTLYYSKQNRRNKNNGQKITGKVPTAEWKKKKKKKKAVSNTRNKSKQNNTLHVRHCVRFCFAALDLICIIYYLQMIYCVAASLGSRV